MYSILFIYYRYIYKYLQYVCLVGEEVFVKYKTKIPSHKLRIKNVIY